MSKGYTIQYFIDLFTNTNNTVFKNNTVYDIVSPRYGSDSVKAQALTEWLGFNPVHVANGVGGFRTLGATPRTRLLKALKNRQRFGTTLVG